MTRRIGLLLELEDDVVLSQDAATAGDHRSLDHIPGAALLGALAGRFYAEALRDRIARMIFHTGAVRFGDGLPVDTAGRVGWPTPLCLHRLKGGADLANLALRQRGNEQWQQLRDGHVALDGQALMGMPRGYVLRTAIRDETGTADEGRLFGYETLPRGARFVASLSLEDEVPSTVERRMIDLLTKTSLRIGRSRSTEHGRVRASEILPPALPSTASSSAQVVIWALSDLCLSDAMGQPTLAPQPGYFGLPSGHVDWERSFIRTRRYAPWNGTLRARMPERIVICRGSVMTFAGVGDAGGLRWVGAQRENGLGACVANPVLLLADPLQAEKGLQVIVARAPRNTAEPSVAQQNFITWLDRRASGDAEQDRWASEKAADLPRLYGAIRLFNDVPVERAAGPGPTQWARVMVAVRGAPLSAWDNLLSRLFEDERSDQRGAICRGDAWDRRYGQHAWESIRGWFETCTAEARDRSWPPSVLAKLAREAANADQTERNSRRPR